MPVGTVLRLEEYRDRRSSRLRVAQALHRADPRRRVVFDHLMEIASLAGADRAAAVWVDEHGCGQIHPYVVVDQLCDAPRRAFVPEPLRCAWQIGVPSAYDAPSVPTNATPSSFAVALGSDGVRAWFVVADSIDPRPPIDRDSRDRIMFVAGECAAVVLHRDLDSAPDSDPSVVAGSRFAGWDILADLDGRESDEVQSRRIAQRFVVARLIRLLVDDDLTVARERVVEQARRARAELAHGLEMGPEPALWMTTLDALQEGRLEVLAMTLVELGDVVEEQGHTKGAEEIYDCAYAIAAAVGAARPAAHAARLRARLLRRGANWTEARRWFGLAGDVAEAAGLSDMSAQVLVGLAGVSKETGNLPAARKTFHEALARAERSGDGDTIALVHHGLLGLEHAAGNLAEGVQHGWLGVALYQSEHSRLRCLAGLAGVLMDLGDRESAEDAWHVVASSSDEVYYRVFAHDALSHIAALRGDRRAFEAHSSRCDALAWESGTSSAKVQILFYRGLSYQALGEIAKAKTWLTRAVLFAREHSFNQILFRAEDALASLRAAEQPSVGEAPAPAAPREVREGLRAMRQSLVSAPA